MTQVPVASNSREARFLAARLSRTTERTTARESHDNEPSSKAESRDRFWTTFRGRCSELHRRIDALGFDEGEDATGDTVMPNQYVTAAQRNAGRAELESIHGDLTVLRKVCGLGSSSTVIPEASLAYMDANGDEGIDRGAVSILPPGDLRLLADELSRISDRLNDAREVLCPRDVFTFKRYRAAISERSIRSGGAKGSSTLASSSSKMTSQMNTSQSVRRISSNVDDDDDDLQYGITIGRKSDCCVIAEADGAIVFSPLKPNQDYWSALTANAHSRPSNESNATSVLVKNLKNCQIILKGLYRSLHFVGLENCDTFIARPVTGPAHITLCRNSKLRLACHQLRLHDSVGMTCHIHVSAGPIIEGCKCITFYGDYYHLFPENIRHGAIEVGMNKFREVKDFNWLRTMVKSPNFEVRDSYAITSDCSVANGTNDNSHENPTADEAKEMFHEDELGSADDDTDDEL